MTSIPVLDLALISAHVYRKNDRVGTADEVRDWVKVEEFQLANALLGTTH